MFTQIRHKVVVFDVVHTKKEHGGFKTRHLYPPKDFYSRSAQLCGAVIIGSCRVGGTREVALGILRKEAAAAWDVGEKRKEVNRADGSSDIEDDSSVSQSSDSDSDGDSSNSGSSRGGDSGSGVSDSGTNTSSRSDNRRAGSSGASKNGNSLVDSFQRRYEKNDDHGRRNKSGGRTGEGEADGSGKTVDKAASRSARGPRGDVGDGSGGGVGNIIGNRKPRALLSTQRGSDSIYGLNKACAPMFDVAIYEEKMSMFGRVLRNALSGECIKEGHHDRVLIADLYTFLRREFQKFEQPREGSAEPGPELNEVDRREAAKKERESRAKLGAKARAEKAREEKEAARIREQERAKLQRTQARNYTIAVIKYCVTCLSFHILLFPV